MKIIRFLIVGSGGRESAFALKLSKDVKLFSIMDHKNPTIIECVEKTNGAYCIGNSSNPQTVLNFVKKHTIDYVFVNSDAPLANGVVDILLENNIKAIGGTKEATRIEWDKIYSIEMMSKVCSEYTPFYKIVSDENELKKAIKEFQNKNLQVVVKPQGLTGGKGVKIMPEHLSDYKACVDYASLLLSENTNERVLLVEKLKGIEFTIMGITDGQKLVLSPATYDYPFRLEDDKGSGTGGMGCFTSTGEKLPFMNNKDLYDCKTILERIILEIKNKKLFFNGVLNGGFFKTRNGIKFMEFNSRFGDPEGLNILSILKGSFSKLLINLWNKTLSDDIVSFYNKASVIKYFVAKEYPLPSDKSLTFKIDKNEIKKMGVQLFFASCEKLEENTYITLKKSRVIAFGALADKIDEASGLIDKAVDKYFKGLLEYRRDIGSKESLEKLKIINDTL